jgi:hypothetical protein
MSNPGSLPHVSVGKGVDHMTYSWPKVLPTKSARLYFASDEGKELRDMNGEDCVLWLWFVQEDY